MLNPAFSINKYLDKKFYKLIPTSKNNKKVALLTSALIAIRALANIFLKV